MKTRSLLLLCLLLGSEATAGTGPETTLLVVNADSPLSLTVANHYLELRPIPLSHVVWLHDIPGLGTITMEQFREKILDPILAFMEEEELAEQVDTIVYSADFPYAVRLREELKRNNIKYNRYIGKSASITGLTYFSRMVQQGKAGYIAPNSNHYFRKELGSRLSLGKPATKADLKQGKKAESLLHKKKYEKASSLLEQLVERNPSHAYFRLLLARALAGAGNSDEAMSQLEKLPDLGFENSLVLRNAREFRPLQNSPRLHKLVRELEKPRSRFEPPRGFSSRYHWSRSLLRGDPRNLDRYYLAATLAFTGQRGNSLSEIENYLGRSRESDAKHPKGTVYLMENNNVRTETRQPWFAETCALLGSIGHACEILTRKKNGETGILPKNRRDIIGLVAGYRRFHWKRSGSSLLPGAIAEALTSYGGDFDNRAQTKLTEFLRQGASGSSGAVAEPYSFHQKFPLPLMHYYYALGYSLAESWYQAVASPYQNILIGDPLTNPFVDPIPFEFQVTPSVQPWQGDVKVRFTSTETMRIDRFEIWIDGKLQATLEPDQDHTLDSRTLADGYHELHLAAVEKFPKESRTTRRQWIRVDNEELHLTLGAEQELVAFGTPLILRGKAPPGSRIRIRQGNRNLISLTTGNGDWESILPTSLLGMGKVTLQAVALTPSGKKVYSKPMIATVKPSSITLPGKRNLGTTHPGLEVILKLKDGEGKIREETKLLKALDGKFSKLIRKNTELLGASVMGHFHVSKNGFYQLAVRTRGELGIEVDGKSFTLSGPDSHYGLRFLPLFLQRGWHEIHLQPSASGFESLRVTLSGEEPPILLGQKTTKQSSKKRKR